jgi:serine phosphatase RsbU (regulator of sigma subunit)
MTDLIAWAVAGLPIRGESESGDLCVVVPFDDGVLVAAIDGLGHGPHAAVAARTAAQVLTANASASLLALIESCHQALRSTRGAVITLAAFHGRRRELTWTGVGNVEGVLLHADRAHASDAVPLRGGVVGFRLPSLRETMLPLTPGDTLILATDGIRSGFARTLQVSASPAQLADSILAHHGKTSDDASVVVARYLGAST